MGRVVPLHLTAACFPFSFLPFTASPAISHSFVPRFFLNRQFARSLIHARLAQSSQSLFHNTNTAPSRPPAQRDTPLNDVTIFLLHK